MISAAIITFSASINGFLSTIQAVTYIRIPDHFGLTAAARTGDHSRGKLKNSLSTGVMSDLPKKHNEFGLEPPNIL